MMMTYLAGCWRWTWCRRRRWRTPSWATACSRTTTARTWRSCARRRACCSARSSTTPTSTTSSAPWYVDTKNIKHFSDNIKKYVYIMCNGGLQWQATIIFNKIKLMKRNPEKCKKYHVTIVKLFTYIQRWTHTQKIIVYHNKIVPQKEISALFLFYFTICKIAMVSVSKWHIWGLFYK